MTRSLSEWLSLLEGRHPTEIELGLDRIATVARRLNLPKPANRVITVAGTNGKGSCIAAMQALLTSAGYSTGVYTSPHLIHFNERVVVNGLPVDDEAFCSTFEQIESACQQQLSISLTYFEFTTLAALLLIAAAEVDFALLEVGLGGRLDAVNIVDSDIAIVTSVSLDHEAWLGSCIDGIGQEKAAIGRAGKPLIYGDEQAVAGVISQANAIGVELFNNGTDFSLQQGVFQSAQNASNIRLQVGDTPIAPSSVACALQALLLANIELSSIDIHNSLTDVVLPGRFQELNYRGRQFILDVAHNPAASSRLAEMLNNRQNGKRVIAIFSIMEDKDIPATVAPLAAVIDKWVLPKLVDVSRAANPQSLQGLLYNAEQTDSIEEALSVAVEEANEQDLILVCGSFYLVGPVLEYMKAQHDE